MPIFFFWFLFLVFLWQIVSENTDHCETEQQTPWEFLLQLKCLSLWRKRRATLYVFHMTVLKNECYELNSIRNERTNDVERGRGDGSASRMRYGCEWVAVCGMWQYAVQTTMSMRVCVCNKRMVGVRQRGGELCRLCGRFECVFCLVAMVRMAYIVDLCTV